MFKHPLYWHNSNQTHRNGKYFLRSSLHPSCHFAQEWSEQVHSALGEKLAEGFWQTGLHLAADYWSPVLLLWVQLQGLSCSVHLWSGCSSLGHQ